MEQLLSVCIIGLGIWGMRRFGAGICTGYDRSWSFLDDPIGAFSVESACLSPSDVRVTVTGVDSANLAECSDALCSAQYNGVFVLDRFDSSQDLCRDGDSTTPIKYAQTLPCAGGGNSCCDVWIVGIYLEHRAHGSAGAPRISVFFGDLADNPTGFAVCRDLNQRIPCGDQIAHDVDIEDSCPAAGSTFCDFSAASVAVDFTD